MKGRSVPQADIPTSAVTKPSTSDDPTANDESAAEAIGRLVREKKFCAAARLYSETTGTNLLDSKLAIDRLAQRHGHAPLSGCASYLALMVLLGGATSWAVSQWLAALL